MTSIMRAQCSSCQRILPAKFSRDPSDGVVQVTPCSVCKNHSLEVKIWQPTGKEPPEYKIVREWSVEFSVVCEHPDPEKDKTYPVPEHIMSTLVARLQTLRDTV